MTIMDLRIENRINPLGLGELCPRFSWKFAQAPDCFLQTGYRLQVALQEDFLSPLWDSGEVSSGESHFVAYGGPELQPGTRYFVRVQAHGTGVAADWSAPAWFETALAPGSWTAPFITPESVKEVKSSRPKALRKSFDIPFAPSGARLRATALGLYELSLNDERIGDAVLTPGWTAYQSRLAYQTYDVTPLLRQGSNTIKCMLGPGWYKGEITWFKSSNLYGKHLALSLQLEVWGADGQVFRLGTDGTWEAADTALLFAEIYHGESCDARLEGKQDWHAVRMLDTPPTNLVPQDGPPVRRQKSFTARLLATPKGGVVFDFGQVLTGWVRFTVQGQAGDRVVIRHAETLDAKGNFYTANLRGARNRIEYILKGGEAETFEPRFSFQGFRYIQLDDWPGRLRGQAPEPGDYKAIVIHSDMEALLDFSCSHGGLNQLHHNITWGWLGNAVDIPTDCPQRDERMGWTGDAQVFAATAARLYQVDRFFTKWLRDMAADQYDNGAIPFVVPDVLTDNPRLANFVSSPAGATGWSDAAIIVPWQVWLATGDRRLLEENWPMMKGWIRFIKSRARDGLLWDTDFHFGDWVALDAKEGSFFGATPNDLTATAYYAYSAGLLAHIARVLGKTEDALEYGDLHDRIVKAFQDEFLTPRGRLAARTQTAHILALVFDLVPPAQRQRTIDDLARLLKEHTGHLTTGFLGTPAFCDALTKAGRLDLAYDLLLKEDFPSWLYQVNRGATTIWEHWDGIKPDGTMWSKNMNSFNHYAYGAVGDWMYRTIGGIRPTPEAPGYKHIIFEPRPGGGITWARETLRTPYGTASMSWSIEGNLWHLSFDVPPNTRATLILPGETREYGSGHQEVETDCAVFTGVLYV